MADDFSIRNVRMRRLLGWALALTLVVSLIAPPAFWLCAVGVFLLFVAVTANSIRTGQWYSWQNEGNLNWFEGWAASTGALMVIIPLAVTLLRAWLSRDGV